MFAYAAKKCQETLPNSADKDMYFGKVDRHHTKLRKMKSEKQGRELGEKGCSILGGKIQVLTVKLKDDYNMM